MGYNGGAAPAAGGGASRNPRNPQMLSYLNRHRLAVGLLVLAAVTAYGARAFFHEDWRGAPLMPLAPSFLFWQALFLPDVHVLLAVAAFRLITFWVWVGVGWMALLRVLRWPSAPAAAPEKES